MAKYVIVGGSVGAIGAVEAIREVDPVGALTVVTEEPMPIYSRPMIGEYLSNDVPPGMLQYRSDQFWDENMVRAFTGRKAVLINFPEKHVELEGGARIDFEKLLIATGSKPFYPRIEGITTKGVFAFTALADADAVKRRLGETKNVVVVGGGLIGVCAAEALAKRGGDVTIVELQDRILSLLLDATASDILRKAIQSRGVNIITGHTVERIEQQENGMVGAAILDNGERLPCGMVVIAIGVRPRTELVLDTGVKVNRGIVVDRFMRTNLPDVYACGDVAEAYDLISEAGRILPQWPVAHVSGRVAGFNMAGEKREYPGGVMMSALKYFDTPVVAAGRTTPEADDGCEVLVAHDPIRALYKKVVVKNGVLQGFIFVGDIEKAGILFYLLRNGVDVDAYKDTLLSEDLGLVSLPEGVRRTMLMRRGL
jgi:NAD(P)H-nitrite reductase large subunit